MEKIQMTIEIDPERIDYDKITEQIANKMLESSLEDIISSNELLEKSIKELIHDKLESHIQMYLKENNFVNEYGKANNGFKEYIKRIINEEIEDVIKENGMLNAINEIYKTSIEEAIVKITPILLCQVLEDYIRGAVQSSKETFRYQAFNDAKGVVRYAFMQNGMCPHTPYGIENLPQQDY